MKKLFLNPLFFLFAAVSFTIFIIGCSKNNDSNTNTSNSIAGTYKGTLKIWSKGINVYATNQSNVSINVIDLGNNAVRIESASKDFSFSPKEVQIGYYNDSVIQTLTSDILKATVTIKTNKKPMEITYGYGSIGSVEFLGFNGVKQ